MTNKEETNQKRSKAMTKKAAKANKRNAQKSTGPKTKRSELSIPNLKHGIFAKIPVLPEIESQQDWESHLAEIKDSLKPFGEIENTLAERIAFLLWRLKRLYQYEQSVLANHIKEIPDNTITKWNR